MNYAAISSDGRGFMGMTKAEVVNQIVKFRFDNGQLISKVKDFKETKHHSYCPEQWTDDERYRDAIKHLYDYLPKYRYTLFENHFKIKP